MQEENIVERAYIHARSGGCSTVTGIVKALKADGFHNGLIEDHLCGKRIRTELRELCRTSVKLT